MTGIDEGRRAQAADGHEAGAGSGARRRTFAGRLLAVATMLACGAAEAAQPPGPEFPLRPVRMIVPNGPGSAPDVVARLLGQRLAELWGQAVVIDNRPGATGLIGADLVAKSAPDGHTLFLVTMTQLIGMYMFQKHMLATDFAPVSMVATTPFALVVSSNTPVKTMAEWIAYAKARPGQLVYASGGQWGSSHLCIEAFNEMIGAQMTHVPFPTTTGAFTGLIGGQVQFYCPAVPSLHPYTQNGRVRVLGVTYQKPTRLLPGVPPVADSLPGFELLGWYGMQVALKTPPAVIAKLNSGLAAVLAVPEVQERLLAVGAEAQSSTPAAFGTFLQKQTGQWSKVLRDSGAKPGQP